MYHSLLDNAPNSLVGCVIQKGCVITNIKVAHSLPHPHIHEPIPLRAFCDLLLPPLQASFALLHYYIIHPKQISINEKMYNSKNYVGDLV